MISFFTNHWRQLMLLIFSLITFFILVVFLIGYIEQNQLITSNYKGIDVTNLLSIFSLAVSLTAFASIIFTLQQTRNDNQNELKQITIDLFKELRGAHFRDARDKAWQVKSKWDKNQKGYQKKLLIAMFTDKTNSESGVEISKEQIQAIYDLIGFYSMLSLYEGNETHLKALNYFYYGWWRKFLYELALEKDSRRSTDLFIEDDLKNGKVKFDRDEYIKNISFVSSLKRLDGLCGFKNLPIDFEIHKSGG